MPTNAGHRSNIRAAVIEDRKDSHGEVNKYKHSDADGDDNGHSLEDREKEDHQTSKKEEYGEVKEYTSGSECTCHAIFQGAEEQKATDARSVSRLAWNLRHLTVSARPLLHLSRRNSRNDAEHEAQQPKTVNQDDGEARRISWVRRRWDVCAVW